MNITDLRCEYLAEPTAVENLTPHLSWLLESPRRNQRQVAYQVLVASSSQILAQHKGDLWNSGKVKSGETVGISFNGSPLQSRMQCYWKVRIWDQDGTASDWSKPSEWRMGLLNPSDWKAIWIGFDHPRKSAIADKKGVLLPPPCYLQRHFKIPKPIARATLYGTALGNYETFLNGKRAASDYFNPGWTDYQKRIYYRGYDVTDLLQEGENAVGIILAEGWYAGYVGYAKEREHYGRYPRVLLQLEIVLESGETLFICTDRNWRATTGPMKFADFLKGEYYDARKEIPLWAQPTADLSNWATVNTSKAVKGKLQSAPHPPVRVFKTHRPKSITEPRPGIYVLDMGTNFAGFARLKVTAAAGTKIRLRFGERLQKDGTIYTRNLRHAKATDTYICKGAGEEVFEPLFTFHGFQYIQVTGYPGELTKGDIVGIELSTAVPVAGDFRCSNAMLNKLYANILQTQRANFIDIPTDCPQRDERMGWTGDAQIYIRTAAYNNDVQAFFRKWLQDLLDAQRSDGQFPMVAPLKVAGGDGGPAWADAGVICPYTIYEIYGDRRILEICYPGMKRFVEFCRKRAGKDLLPPAEFHCFGDWLNIKAETPKPVIFSAYFAISTHLLSKTAEVLGKQTDADRFGKLFQRLRTAFQRAYVDDSGRISGDTQTAYALALQYDLLDEPFAEMAAAHLVENIKDRNWHLSTGFVGTRDLLPALSKIGRADIAYRLLQNETFPSWGFSIKHGAASIWERWDGWTPERGFQAVIMNSFSHYAFGAVYQWMFENIGGIRTKADAFREIEIAPEIGETLKHAKIAYHSIRGFIQVRWRQNKQLLQIDIQIPPNTTAVVHLPAASLSEIKESGNPLKPGDDIHRRQIIKNKVVLHIGSGEYKFSIEKK